MTTSDDYVREKLWAAMDALAVSTASLQMRLADAATSALVRLDETDFADSDDRALFREIMDKLTRYGAGGQIGAIETSARELDDDAALAVAGQIRNLYGRYFPL